MGIQILVSCDVVILDLFICTFITTISQQMAAKCLKKEARFYLHRNPGVKSLDLARRKDEKVSEAR